MTLAAPTRRTPARGRWDDILPPALRPAARAYLLGYASVVAPRLLTLLAQYVARHRRTEDGVAAGTRTLQSPQIRFLKSAENILRSALEWQRFPAFCAVLVGGSTLLEKPWRRVFDRTLHSFSEISRARLSRWFASFIAAWLSILLLQSRQSAAFTETVPEKSCVHPGVQQRTIRYGGRTLDLTLLAVTRALDVIIGEFWSRHKARRVAAGSWTSPEALTSRLADSGLFALSTGMVMWTWIYTPQRLPRAYDKWIGSAAAVDARLLEALRRCRAGLLRYGTDTGEAPLLGAMCKDLGLPEHWGDPAVTVPYPCDIVHMGVGPSCERHAVVRFARSFRWSLATYLPLTLLLATRRPTPRNLARATLSAARSSSFLGALIALFYYGVCLARTRVGPKILGTSTAARQRIDAGICVGAGCILCGWSILLEVTGRRKDLALFVAPRALAAMLPRRYDAGKQWRERLVFAASVALVFTCVVENKRRVRGVLGSVLGGIMRP